MAAAMTRKWYAVGYTPEQQQEVDRINANKIRINIPSVSDGIAWVKSLFQ